MSVELIRRGQSSVYGQVSDVVVKGLTVTNLLEDGEVLRVIPPKPGDTGLGPVFFDNLNLPQDRYLIFYELVTTLETYTLNSPYYNSAQQGYNDPNHKTKNNTIGRKVWKLDAPEIITKIGWWVYNTESEVKVKNFMVVKATEEDWLLSEEELIQKYNFINGTKSTNSVRVKSIGKNLFDKNSLFINGYILDNDGNKIIRADGAYSSPFRIKGGKPSTISGKLYVAGEPLGNNVYYLDDNFRLLGKAGNFTTTPYTFTPPLECKYICIQCPKSALAYLDTWQIEEGTVATPYEHYKESIVNVNLPEPLRSLPNGVKDEVRVSEGKLIKRVSDEFTLPMSDWRFNSINEQGFVLLVNFTNLPNFAAQKYGSFIPTTGMVVNNSNLPAYTTTSSTGIRDNANTECIATGYQNGTNLYIVVHQDNYNKTQDNAGANAWVNENMQGVTLTYQLAEPVITYQDPTPIQLFPNGTRWLEFGSKETATYNAGIAVSNTAIPIKEMIKVDKIHLENGHWKRTAIDLANVTVAGDGLSFTVAGAVGGELYEFAYYYDPALSTMPELVIPSEPTLKTFSNRCINL